MILMVTLVAFKTIYRMINTPRYLSLIQLCTIQVSDSQGAFGFFCRYCRKTNYVDGSNMIASFYVTDRTTYSMYEK